MTDLLETSLHRWELVEWGAVIFVIVGVVGEYLADFTKILRNEERQKRLAKLSTLILIVALAAELVCLVRVSQISGEITARLRKDTAEANQSAKVAESKVASAYAQAAEAQKIAEQEKLERVKLEIEVNAAKSLVKEVAQKQAPRTISPEQKIQFIQNLATAPKGKIEFRCIATNNEATVYTSTLKEMLSSAGYEIVEPTLGFLTNGGPITGILLKVKNLDTLPMHALSIKQAFVSIGIKVDGAAEDAAFPLPDDTIRIYVYGKN